MVARSSCLLPFFKSFGLVVGCLHAWDNEGYVVVGFTLDFLHIIVEI